MYYFVTATWLVVTTVSYVQGNRKFPMVLAVLGVLLQLGIWMLGIGYIGMVGLAILAIAGMFSVPEIFFPGR
ncbi:hypothetical protein [Sulfuriroseicoccus oceanibius]|uniref:Uncharacterized protein n=1 Tax=Sulfuriroseicoccus oceanibius TaxID=2707525 RepID=A0A6B3L2X0_9BACT|nr:hypothetical protein [Sulfuriroseicoccus oceanibius]QQL44558.1 hypothetical protein G3M56_011805 [Sulfuriroseicoccus oceanibius]